MPRTGSPRTSTSPVDGGSSPETRARVVDLPQPVVTVGCALIGWLLISELPSRYKQRALAVAHAVAADPLVASAAAHDDPAHLVQTRAESVRQATGALFVVVTNRRGLRLSHPNPDLLGQPVSTDPSAALRGRDVVVVERGTLGLSAR